MKLTWLDLRQLAPSTPGDGGPRDAMLAEATQQRIDAIVAADPADLKDVPPTISRVLCPPGPELPADAGNADIVILDHRHGPLEEWQARYPAVQLGQFIEVTDAHTLDLACASARSAPWTVLSFRDATRIPLEIVLAAATGATGSVITVANDPLDAEILYGVLEHGSDGVMMAAHAVGDATRLKAAATPATPDIALVELEVMKVDHIGMGERACVDTCSYLRPDEGLLVGSRSRGLILCVSETHPLPYMPTRPFRVNAGAIMSYTLAAPDRTRYLSELRAGGVVLAVDAAGHSRYVTVGRVKIERRPLLSVDACAPDGRVVNLIVQDDWHVRILGPGGAVLNSTELRPGDRVLGHLPHGDRHVGYAIDELCYEQ
ncbi:3-dehydroquinate synthase II family protein [Luedemannella helvata]|uniref:3-dehydroquinate synthase II n=1 Tax=Luedemannella helvata TaxID=349315 RepID=A0ABN2JTS1_9ACTN